MFRRLIAWMTRLLAMMSSAVKCTSTCVATLKRTCPALTRGLSLVAIVDAVALHLISTLSTHDVLLDLSTIASGRYTHFTGTTETDMACAIACVLSAWHELAAHFAARPRAIVVRLRASLRHFMLSAEAHLRWAHVRAGRTRPGMTGKLARMRTLSGSFLTATRPA